MAESGKSRRERLTVVIGEHGERIIDPGHVQTREPAPGRSIEDLASDPGQQAYVVMPIISGSQGKLDGRVGGRPVTTAELKFKGGPLLMEGQFPEGSRVRVIMEFEITDVNFALVKHQGHVVGKKRIHVGELEGYGQIPATGTIEEALAQIALTSENSPGE